MKTINVVAAIVIGILLSGCGTPYHADFSKPKSPDAKTDPYQEPVPNAGAASVLRDIITH